MKFLKHIGRHGDRKVAIIYREIPEEKHMALVAYVETLPVAYQNAVMRVLESEGGQQAESLSDELFKNKLPDGRNILHTLHNDGMMKKVQTEVIIVTPNESSTVRLDELNKILDEMAEGKEATEKLAELDSKTGLQGEIVNAAKHIAGEDPASLERIKLETARNMVKEAEGMKTKASSMLQEAYKLDPSLKPTRAKRKPAKESNESKQKAI